MVSGHAFLAWMFFWKTISLLLSLFFIFLYLYLYGTWPSYFCIFTWIEFPKLLWEGMFEGGFHSLQSSLYSSVVCVKIWQVFSSDFQAVFFPPFLSKIFHFIVSVLFYFDFIPRIFSSTWIPSIKRCSHELFLRFYRHLAFPAQLRVT